MVYLSVEDLVHAGVLQLLWTAMGTLDSCLAFSFTTEKVHCRKRTCKKNRRVSGETSRLLYHSTITAIEEQTFNNLQVRGY